MRVMDGGCTDSLTARAPSVGEPNNSTPANAEAWDGVSPPSACWRRQR